MNERIRALRAALGMNQRDFSDRAKIGHSTLAMFETGDRLPKDIHVSQICSTFGVSEKWLRTGEGEMFEETDASLLGDLTRQYGLDSGEQEILAGFLELPHEQRLVVKSLILKIADRIRAREATETEMTQDELDEIIAQNLTHEQAQ